MLTQAGFERVDNQPFTVHHVYSLDSQELRGFIEYVDSWLAPTVEQAATKLGKDVQRLKAGLNWFVSIPKRDNGAVSATIYRAIAIC